MMITIKQHEQTGDLYIDVPWETFTNMGWDESTELVWCVGENENIILRPAADNIDGIPVEFINLTESDNNNDSGN